MSTRAVEQFLNRVKKLMEVAGLTPADLSRQTGIAPSQLSQYLSGKVEPAVAQCERIADALGVQLSELFESAEKLPEAAPTKVVIERRKISEELREAILETAHIGAAAAMDDVKKAIKELSEEKAGKKKRGA